VIFFSPHYSSFQCQIILPKSLWYTDLKKHFLSILKTVLLVDISEETLILPDVS